MKACDCYIDQIILSLDGALAQAEEKQLQEHMACCEGCRCLYETYRNIDAGLFQHEEEAPEGLSKSVMQQIRLEKEKSRPIYYLKRMKFSLTALAACLVLLVAGKVFGTPDVVRDATEVQAQTPQTMAATAEAPAVAEDTALMPAYDGTAEAAMEEKTTEITVAEAAEAQWDDGAMLQGRTGTSENFSAVLDALNRDGYRGDLVELFDMTEEEIYECFPQVETLVISSGDRVYQVSCEQFEQAEPDLAYGAVASTDEVGEWVFLWLRN